MHPFGLAMAGHDVDTAVTLLAADVEFRSPVVFTPYRGRDAVAPLLYAVADVLEDFRYTREIGSPDGRDLALVFRARAGGKEIEGCDFLHLDDSGLIDELFVMIRPMSGVHALAEAMKARLDAASSGRQPT
ncbi:nuclear transport factor 2 family protein [Streptomyces sp. NPDC050534]|uniref:nuclear transport factor 2 family protein n=1 Tax=Streptomyces sp. NPDC050534 TaxID=3365625 RepID=UPI00379406EF